MGDYYNTIVTIEPEDITITEMSVQIESVESENISTSEQ